MAVIINGIDNNQTVTISLASLANGGVATSSSIDNSSNRYLNADVQVKMRTGTSVSSTGTVCLMFLKSSDGGVTFDDADESNASVLKTFIANASTTDYILSADTGRQGGLLAEFFKISILNETGSAFDSSSANFSVKFVGKKIRTEP